MTITPDIVRGDAVIARFSFTSRDALDQAVRRGKFPKPIKLGGSRAVGWLVADLDAWVAARVAERDRAA
jgi:prophage regulatory protein